MVQDRYLIKFIDFISYNQERRTRNFELPSSQVMSEKFITHFNPHGGNIFDAARSALCEPEEIIDFSANINFLGPPSGLGQIIAKNFWKIRHYPEPGSPELLNTAARHFKIHPNMILAANGATEILDAAAKAFCSGNVIIPGPSYLGYEESAAKNRQNVRYILPQNKDRLYPSLEQIETCITDDSLVFIGRPNNPTGHLPDFQALKDLIQSHPRVFFVVDESFLDFTSECSLAGEELDNMLIVYSLTKFYALPGLRLGLGLGKQAIIQRLSRLVSPWSVNVLAQEAGRFCLDDSEFQQKSRQALKEVKSGFLRKLANLSWLDVFPGKANFLLCRINDDRFNADQLAGKLIQQRILVRSARNFFGLDDTWFRLAVKSEQDNDFLCSCLEELTSAWAVPFTNGVRKKTPALMIQGVCSGAGKSLVAAGLCRILHQDGIRVAPFKSQNMSLNSYVTLQGHEMGRAQVVQARACGLEPDARMNPVLLKPNSDTGSQVIVLGKPVGNMDVNEYIRFKERLFCRVKTIYDDLSSEYDAVILEGAGSPAEINLKKHDLVNMNMARHAEASALLVGDIDRGGVFASFAGTFNLLLDWEKELVAGLLINKFRGQKDLLQSAIEYTLMVTGCNVLGIIPFVHDLGLPEEDSVGFKSRKPGHILFHRDQVNIGVVDLPHISNFTDFDPLYPEPDVNVAIIRSKKDFHDEMDVLILPGSKNVAADLRSLKEAGLDREILAFAAKPGKETVGICGGLQMLGLVINDYYGLESSAVKTGGLGLLPLETDIMPDKTLKQVDTVWIEEKPIAIRGYEIHHGKTAVSGRINMPVQAADGSVLAVSHPSLPIWATYVHGIFDSDEFRRFWLDRARKRKGLQPLRQVQACYDIDASLDRLAWIIRQNIDMRAIYRILGI